MIKGNLAEACRQYEFIASHAQAPVDQLFAQDQYSLCKAWMDSHMVLVPDTTLEEGQNVRLANQRTTGELVGLYGASLYFGIEGGLWFGFATDAESSAGYVLPVFALSGLGIGAVALADRSGMLHYGVPQSISTGMFFGFEQGMLWAFWNQARVPREDEWEASTVLGLMTGMTALGGVVGGAIGSSGGVSPGRASFVGSAATWGSALSATLVGSLVSYDGLEGDKADEQVLMASILGLNIGAAGGMLTAGRVSPSVSRTRFLDLGGIAGVIVGAGTYFMFSDSHGPEYMQGLSAFTGLGMAGGLSLAWYLTKDMPGDPGVGHEDASPVKSALRHARVRVIPQPGGGELGVSGSW